MQLSNVNIAGRKGLNHILIRDGRIARISDAAAPIPEPDQAPRLVFNGALAFPGLINSHDHLDFNLFPSLKSRVYKNYKEWGSDIHQRYEKEIARVLRIPRHLRVRWGLYKNLLNGVTTVVHHGKKLPVSEDLISVCQGSRSFHSVSGEKYWRLQLINPFFKRGRPVVIHIGEGTDAASITETDELIRWNIFKRRLIGIHGISMTEQQARSFESLIWCPASNYFLYERTAPVHLLRQATRIIFGTDSTLTASWNIWEHLRRARQEGMTGDAELFDMVTRTPAGIWGLNDNASLDEGQRADLVIARAPENVRGWDTFYSLNPEDLLLVLHKGNIRLFDHTLHDQLAGCSFPSRDFHSIQVGKVGKFVQGDLPGLLDEIRKVEPSAAFPVASAFE